MMYEASQGREGQAFPDISPAPPATEAQGDGESILVVEDHPALRELICAFLADGGYQVKAVGRPGEAEAAWTRENGAFDLLVTDLVMPEKSGRALAEDLTARKPSLGTLYISGYAQGTGPGKKVEGPYLQKPFTRNELLHMVRGIFKGRRAKAPVRYGDAGGPGGASPGKPDPSAGIPRG